MLRFWPSNGLSYGTRRQIVLSQTTKTTVESRVSLRDTREREGTLGRSREVPIVQHFVTEPLTRERRSRESTGR